jgi:hypothetical protein
LLLRHNGRSQQQQKYENEIFQAGFLSSNLVFLLVSPPHRIIRIDMASSPLSDGGTP